MAFVLNQLNFIENRGENQKNLTQREQYDVDACLLSLAFKVVKEPIESASLILLVQD